jgi:SEC-C motif
MAKVGRNDPCSCGSRVKYKHCCLRLDEGRPARVNATRSAKSLRDKNIALLNDAGEIFGLGRPWEKIKASFSDAKVREFYTFAANLWPTDTDVNQLLPEPDSTLRALYLGEYEPELMVENVFRFSLYADQILLTNLFPNPNNIAEKYNPIVHPDEWKTETLKLLFHLMILAPWIDDGLVVLIPDPGDFNRELRMKTWSLASERLKGWTPSVEDLDKSQFKKRMQREFLRAPRRYWDRMVREVEPGMSDSDREALLDRIEHDRASDPLLLNETMDNMSSQLCMTHAGANLEMGTYICQATGAFPYTNLRFRWKEILGAAVPDLDPTAKVWSPLTNTFQQLRFKFLNNVDPKFVTTIRREGRLEGFRSYLRNVWKTVGGEPDSAKSESLARDFRDELTQAFNEAQADWSLIDRELMKWGVPTMAGGLVSGLATAFVPGHMSLSLPGMAGFAVAGVSELIQAAMKRREFRKKVPMSVFIDLENR